LKTIPLPIDYIKLTGTLSAAREICRVLSNEILESLKAARDQGVPANGIEQDANPAVVQRHRQAKSYIAFLNRIFERCNVQVLDRLKDRICSIVDEDSTYEGGAVIIRQGFHEQLDSMKEQWQQLPGKE
jgi:hypothetical protein